MSVILTFLAAIALIAGWWLSRQGITSKPWLESGTAPSLAEFPQPPPYRLGTAVFLVVIGGLFAMLGSAFVMQIDETPWQLVPLPALVWFNTALLMLSSLSLHFASRDADHRTHVWLALGSVTAVGFMAGQLQIWTTLTDNGYGLSGAPAASFFYLITGLHGLHILGGLVALGLVWFRLAQTGIPKTNQAPVALCALYWHGLLVIWLLLLALLSGLGNEFLALCRSALT
ncbi:MAG: cytochrome c oxidase subunit 3 [Rhodobacteraceae bacterium]|nr:cytochrome c oxidase subunit 3 [Paracoccaceae bacterium]